MATKMQRHIAPHFPGPGERDHFEYFHECVRPVWIQRMYAS